MKTSDKLMRAAKSRDNPGQHAYLLFLAFYYANIEAEVCNTYARHCFFRSLQLSVESSATREYCRTAADSLAVFGTYNMKSGRVIFYHLVKLLEARKVMNPKASERPLQVARSLLEHGAHSEVYYDTVRLYLEERRDAIAGSSKETDQFYEDILQTFDRTSKNFFKQYNVFDDPVGELFPRELLVPRTHDFEVHFGPYRELVPYQVPFDVIHKELPKVVPRIQGPETHADPYDASHIKDAVAEVLRLRADARKRRREYEEHDGVIYID